MIWLQYAAVLIAILVVLFPEIKKLLKSCSLPSLGTASKNSAKSSEKKVPTFAEAINALSVVRTRINHTDSLGDQQKSAIDSLTLALVDGSDS